MHKSITCDTNHLSLKQVDTEEIISWCSLTEDKKDLATSDLNWEENYHLNMPTSLQVLLQECTQDLDPHMSESKQNMSLTWNNKTLKFVDGREHRDAHDNTAPSSKALILVPVRHAHILTTSSTWYDKSYERGNHL